MLDLDEVNRVVDKAASAALKGVQLSKVYSEPTVDSQGREAFCVTIVVAGDRNQAVNGDHALNAMVRIQRDLQKSGEERLPIVEFATEDDLDINGDIES